MPLPPVKAAVVQRPLCHRMPTRMECSGPTCAAFVVLEQHGSTVNGACADTVQALALTRISEAIVEYLSGDEEGDGAEERPVAEG